MIDDVRSLVHDARRLVAFSGAGLSAESGVATFRDAATNGLWTKFDPTRLASPEGFADDPELVTRWYNDRRRSVHEAAPNPAHVALARHPTLVNVTQNVDDLLERAGATRVVHVHGRIAQDRCHGDCGYEEAVDLADPPPLRACPECGARLRPGVVWFGETLPDDAWTAATDAAGACDVMLVIGTSAAVYPAAGLIDVARAAGARIIVVNTEPSGAGEMADVELMGPAGTIVPRLFG